MPKKDERWSILLTTLENIDINKTLSISELKDLTGLHFSTIEEMLNLLQLIPELPFKIRILDSKTRKIIIKDENTDSNKTVNIKLDEILKAIKEIKKQNYGKKQRSSRLRK